MSCKQCACGITVEDLKSMDIKSFNLLLNDISNGSMCEETEFKIKEMLDKNKMISPKTT